ncbi:tetratricopeptide repeat protein [Nocardia sp. NRRL S-836]|uniref:tetratricopeptide repeat protein n=1 Tax=Nocardia sp. NRRL S-836 TaxID=1519492 RepID=UPI0006C1C073|nr:tetratricopeptide repeat protein [Nocardia sp. NRRL S-836]KOV81758.1 hypothetical protein ADL03_27545 [Nocardia sp. NRRL S-836]
MGAFEEAVMICRRLAEMEPSRYLSDLAQFLKRLGVSLAELGRREEALGAFEEAVMICRRLAEREPSRYRADLADSLNSLGVILTKLGRHQEALEANEEAVRFDGDEGRASSPSWC